MAALSRKPASIAETEGWLRDRFRLQTLRARQATVIKQLIDGSRVLFVAPTGHGKSLCYQALAGSPWTGGLVLVFQPLKALMQEQVEKARLLGLRAELVNSDQDEATQRVVLERAAASELDLLFLSPERQGNSLWLEHVGRMEIKGVVIDEAHCISQWGHDFRPWYRRLVETIMNLGLKTPVLAVTATAPPEVVEDVMGQMSDGELSVFVERLPSFRSNIELACWSGAGFAFRLGALLHLARASAGQAGIAYVLTQSEAEMASEFLRENGIAASCYHAGMNSALRAESLRGWRAGETSLVCATSALGMGLDRADVRWIAHLGVPDSLLRYVQEIGRAGRDEKPARAIVLHDPEAQPIYEAFIRGSHPPPADFRAVASALRTGCTTRTQIVLNQDVPDPIVQRILDDFVHDGLCERERASSPYKYAWRGGDQSGVPEGVEAAIGTRRLFLEEAFAYTSISACRAVQLARAMGDDPLPAPCGMCDRCRPSPAPKLDAVVAVSSGYLAKFCPSIAAHSRTHEAGVALSHYGLGAIGEAVKQAKYAGKALPSIVVDRAVEVIGDSRSAYAGAHFGAVVSIPSRSPAVGNFARELARRLGLPWSELVKTREIAQQKKFRSRQLKEKNVGNVFAPVVGAGFASVLLIDDVLDSGASIRAASKALAPARVYPLVMARSKHQDDL